MTRYTNAGRKRTYLEAGFEEKHASQSPKPEVPAVEEPQAKRKRGDKKVKRVKDELTRKESSEARRLRRVDERRKDTVCFACREKGHAAKECPKSNLDETAGDALPTGNNLVGVCYRCGSQKHSLSRCKKPENPRNPSSIRILFRLQAKGPPRFHLSTEFWSRCLSRWRVL
ncbi:zinc knuckle protein [Rhizoctonia solani AG-3 Rhs1AP]|uniref:Zinc knuckle protein n=1 Tax=Rhizoctonia solani AG-3 Rhs1AP TaxID=1086054 RepID=X8JK39_9AGAM|nr:zinc knuckle protein [Rhizoctonia solani AG-3 Rhs1AP]